MQDSLKVNGIVLSVMPVNEADRRVLLLTKELGKMSAFARGARRPTSPFVGAVKPFAFGVFYLNNGRSAYSIQKTEISEYFEELAKDVDSSVYGQAFMELSAYFSHENEDGTESLALLYFALRALSGTKIPKALVRAVFELKLLSVNGLLPEFSVCPKCKKQLESGFFSPALMQPLCADCGSGDPRYPLSKSTVYTLEFIRLSPVNRLFTFRVTDEVQKELSEVTELFFRQVLDRELPARSMLKMLL